MDGVLRSNVALLFSDQSWRAYGREAQRRRETYRFTSATGDQREWLKGEYAYLAPNALSSVLHRWEIKHDWLIEDDLARHLAKYSTLFLPNAGYLRDADIRLIADWLEHPASFLVVTGKTNLPSALLGLRDRQDYRPDGYTGWCWTADSPFGNRDHWEQYYISSYRGYTCSLATPVDAASVLADLYEFTGDVSSPTTATVQRLGAAVVATDKSVYVANQVFEYLGGVLQAHINVEDVRMWSNPPHWGDTLAFLLRSVLRATPARRLWDTTLCPFSTYNGVLQLRHDVDHEADDSIDLSMLEFEVENAVPASYYLMDPAFCKTRCTPMGAQLWVEQTARYNFIEAAQHNDSVEGDPPRWITGTGLFEHIRESDLSLGVRSQTAGRHMGFLVYPETIDAMDYLYQNNPDMLGLCTFSLYDVLAYGERNPVVIVQGKAITYTTYNPANPAVPAAISGYWFPYHVVVSTVDHHASLRGWDVTHDTDCSYERIEELFAGQNSRSATVPSRLENGVFTIQYETQLARAPHENRGQGHLPWLRYAVAYAERHNFWITTKVALYERMTDYQDVRFRREEDGSLLVSNPTDRTIAGLMVRTAEPIDTVMVGDRRCIHIVDRHLFTLPSLAPGETITVRATWDSKALPTVCQPNSRMLEITTATYHPPTERISITGRAIRKGFIALTALPPNRALVVRVEDNRGTVRTRLHSGPDGTLIIPILGQQDNVIPIRADIQLP